MAPQITEPISVMTVLIMVAAFYFWLEQKTQWRIFNYFPPLLFIYATPILLTNLGPRIDGEVHTLIPTENEAYSFLRTFGLPVFIVLMLLRVDVVGAIRIMGKGVFVMLIGSLGVVVGGVAVFWLSQQFNRLPSDSWKAFGTLAGSWIGGTGNMNAAWTALEGTPNDMTMAAVADNLVYVVWLPILLGSKSFADRFNRWARVPPERIQQMEVAASARNTEARVPQMRELLYLAVIGIGATALSFWIADQLPVVELGGKEVISRGTWIILLVTTFGLLLSATPARDLPASDTIAMAIIYVFVAQVGARVNLIDTNFKEVGWFVAAAYVWIAIHGLFVLFGAWLFRIDVHTLAIASAANVGGAASAPVVAAHHRESLVPASILMALLGYAIGNYLAIFVGRAGQLLV